MGIFDDELILPGTITEIVSDYSYGYDTSLFGTTDSVTIIGTAFNGPVGKPVEIYSPEHAKYIFGGTYDPQSRKEATLVAEIIDAWNRGCRTIYAVRVSGQPIYKDFQLAIDTNLKLRVAGIFPSNKNKDVYMTFDNTADAMTLKIYKPAERATIQEKMQGAVEKEESVLVTTFDLSSSFGYTKDTSLLELISTVNQHLQNNVIRLSIVDENGADVTNTSTELKSFAIGVLFPGAYFVGRDSNKGIAATDLKFVFVDETHKPYSNFDGLVYKVLDLNSDVREDLPIYGTKVVLNSKFQQTGVVMADLWDFLSVPNGVNPVFGKDAVDYEEVEISDFELYKRLGSGFAATAYFDSVSNRPKPTTDALNKTAALNDGIYSMLENLRADYRVLANASVDSIIKGRIPKKDEFRVASALAMNILNANIIAKPVIDSKDFTAPKKFSFDFKAIDAATINSQAVVSGLLVDKTIKLIAPVSGDPTGVTLPAELVSGGKALEFKNGTLFMDVTTTPTKGALYRYDNGAYTALNSATVDADLAGKLFFVSGKVYIGAINATALEFNELADTAPNDFPTVFGTKTYALVESAGTVSVYNVDATGKTLTPFGALHQILNDEEDKTLIVIQAEPLINNVITVQTSEADILSLDEFIDLLNQDQDLKKFFIFEIAPDAVAVRTNAVTDIVGAIPSDTKSAPVNDKEIVYSTSIYIPYTTNDNFARQLAQHCTYASLKTAPTHGIMGCTKLMDVGLNAVAAKVDALAALDLNLHAKKSNGADMLDSNNMPYHIGRNISAVATQYVLDNSLDGYVYISNGASGYAGMVSVLPLDQSSTSQPINVPAPMYELTNYQLGRLTQKGFVTIKQSYTKGYVITDGITMALVDSAFRRLSVTRIINAMEEVIRAAVEPFIGKQNNLANRNSMQTSIKSSLDKLKGTLIEGYDFKLTVDPSNLKLGIVNIDYAVVPVYEIREVRNRITVKES
jgi:hypothetical protein